MAFHVYDWQCLFCRYQLTGTCHEHPHYGGLMYCRQNIPRNYFAINGNHAYPHYAGSMYCWQNSHCFYDYIPKVHFVFVAYLLF